MHFVRGANRTAEFIILADCRLVKKKKEMKMFSPVILVASDDRGMPKQDSGEAEKKVFTLHS